MTPIQRLIKVVLSNRYTCSDIAEWATEANNNKRPADSTVYRWRDGKTDANTAVLKAIHDRFQAEGHDAVEGLV